MKQSTVYQGLFLIAFALYANERNQAHPVVIQKETREAVPAPIPVAPELVPLFQRLKVASAFTTPIDGVSLVQTPRAIKIRIQSDELYREGEIAVEETWISLLDQIGSALFTSPEEAKIDYIFSANTTSEKNAFAVSSERADWVLRYYERKYRFRLDEGKYRVMGLGKNTDASTGKTVPMLEIVIKPEHEQ